MTTSPRRGRPPRWSREQIVEAVAEMLLADPAAPLTIARAAEAVGAKPMSLYRHFADRDDLVAAVARHVFADVRPPSGRWQDQIAGWMTNVYARSCQVPQLVQLMASGESAEWMTDSAYLATTLQDAGIDDDRRLAEAVYWVATTTMGHAMIRAASPDHPTTEHVRASLDRLQPEEAEQMNRLIPEFEALQDSGFARVVEWTVQQLERVLAGE